MGNAWLGWGEVATVMWQQLPQTSWDRHRKGIEPQPLAFPVHLVSKLAALTLTGCQLFLPGLRKGGIKGFLWPHPWC